MLERANLARYRVRKCAALSCVHLVASAGAINTGRMTSTWCLLPPVVVLPVHLREVESGDREAGADVETGELRGR